MPGRFDLRPLRRFIAGGALGAAVVASAAVVLPPGSGEQQPPKARKIVLFTVDTLRADRLGCYGYDRMATTPAIDELSKDSVLFERAYAPAPWTVPSMAALFTGRHPSELGVFTNETGIDEQFQTLPELLREAGYRTAAFNSHAVLLEPEMGFQRGFERVAPDRYDVVLEGEHKIAFANVEADLMQWLDSHSEQDFFLWIHDMDPHHPETPGNTYLEDPDWHPYEAEVRWVDDTVARVVRRLQALGVWDETLLILTADHGEAFDEHGLVGHQNVMYDEVLRIPLVIHYPGPFRSKRIREPADLLDVRATILDLARIEAPKLERGSSLVGLLTGDQQRRERELWYHSRYFFEDGRHELAVRDRWWKLLVRTSPSSDRLGETLPNWFIDPETTNLELFNLTTDPGERQNLIGNYPEVSRRLTMALEEWENSNQLPSRQAPRLDDSDLELLRGLGYQAKESESGSHPSLSSNLDS